MLNMPKSASVRAVATITAATCFSLSYDVPSKVIISELFIYAADKSVLT